MNEHEQMAGGETMDPVRSEFYRLLAEYEANCGHKAAMFDVFLMARGLMDTRGRSTARPDDAALRSLWCAAGGFFYGPAGVMPEDKLLPLLDRLHAAAPDSPKPLDDPRLQDLFSCAIDGALTSGYQGVAPAPAGHWLERWWQRGRSVAEREGELQASQHRRAQAQGGLAMTRGKLPPSLEEVALVDMAQVLATFGLRAPSVIYEWVSAGTMPPPIRLSARCSRWLTVEIRALAAARAAGRTDEELQRAVRDMLQARERRAKGL